MTKIKEYEDWLDQYASMDEDDWTAYLHELIEGNQMTEENFCPTCELWNKRYPDEAQRETYFNTLLCPNCFPKRTHNVDKALQEMEDLNKLTDILNHKRPTKL